MRRVILGRPRSNSTEDRLAWLEKSLRLLENASADEDTNEIGDAYTLTNVTTTRTIDADSTTLAEVADVLCTFLQDLKNRGVKRG